MAEVKPLPLPLIELLRRIEAKTEKRGATPCHLWQGRMQQQHPVVLGGCRPPRRGSWQVSVRRVLWISLHGEVPPGHVIVCRYGVPSCVRDEHLHAVTWKERLNGNGKGKGKTGRQFQPQVPTETVRRAVALYRGGRTAKQVAGRLGLNHGTVHGYARGETRRRDTGMGRIPGGYWLRRRRARGDVNGSARLTWQEVLVAIGLWRRGYRVNTIAGNFGVSGETVRRLLRGENWGEITAGLLHLTDERRRLAAQSVEGQTALTVVALRRQGHSVRRIAQAVGWREDRVRDTCIGRSWKEVTGDLTPVYLGKARGAAQGSAVLTEPLVLEIVERAARGERKATIAKALGVGWSTVYSILRGDSWAWLTGIGRDAPPAPAPEDNHPDAALVYQHWKGGQANHA
jgi:hypothetical protein